MTVRPLAVQTLGEPEVTDVAPSLFLPFTLAVKPVSASHVALGGRLEIVGGGDGVAFWMVNDAHKPDDGSLNPSSPLYVA